MPRLARAALFVAALLPTALSAQPRRRRPPPPAPAPAPETPPPPAPETPPPAPVAVIETPAPAAEVLAPPSAPAVAPVRPIAAAPTPRPVALDVEIGARLFGRSLYFTDDIFRQLRPYTLALAPGVSGALEWYPAAHATSRWPSWIGLVASGEYGFVVASSDAQGRSYATRSFGFTAGARVRLTWRRVEAGLTLGYGRQDFSIDRSSAGIAAPEGIPSVRYQSLRAGLSSRVQLTRRVALSASGTFLAVLDAGEISGETFFPRASSSGVELGLGGAFALGAGFEARLHIDWRRYVFSMLPELGDRLVAGGAADDYYSATLALGLRR